MPKRLALVPQVSSPNSARTNVPGIASIPEIEELNIGHALISDAVFFGLPKAVRQMRAAIRRGVRLR